MKRLKRAALLILGGLLPLLVSSCIGPCGIAWLGPSSASETLPAAKYDAAETVYRTFMPGGQWPEAKTNLVYHLSFGYSVYEIPADFLARFAGSGYRVIGGIGLLEYKRGEILEAKSKQPVMTLRLESLSIYHGAADARVVYQMGSVYAIETLQLAHRDGRWQVTRMKEEQRVNL